MTCLLGAAATGASERPNIVVILADDLGYGDVQCLNPERGRIQTPHIDQLAAEGMIFTDAHSGASVCTPTRYGLLTGRYSWRTRLQRGVVTGYAPNLIAGDRLTVARMLKSQGYRTAIVGKWHLDFEYVDPVTGARLKPPEDQSPPPIGSKIPDGPLSRGFDYFHGFHHSRDMRGIIENDTVIAHDPAINMLPRLARKAVEYVDEQAMDAGGEPFFLYVPLNSPHTPILPTKEWQGKSGLGPYADFVMQTDAVCGAIFDSLDRNRLVKNTLVIFTSDNGCSRAADIPGLQGQGHFPSANMRGSKADIWDGGHRVPFIVRWPETVAAETMSDQLICLTDLMATCAEALGISLPDTAGEDSVSFLPALKGQQIFSTRAGVIHHSIDGHFAYRRGKWKLILARGSGGWSSPKENEVPAGSPVGQLYDLESDPGEEENLYEERPRVANRLLAKLESDIQRGRSTAGPALKNDVADILIWKSGRD